MTKHLHPVPSSYRSIAPSSPALNHPLLILLVGLALALLAVMLWRRWRNVQSEARLRLALLEFEEQMPRLEPQLLQAAAATGKPRGLRWTKCELDGSPLFATDPSSQGLYALVGVTVSFEAIEGGDMEEVEAVGNLRWATAVFVHHRSQWTTDGRVVFNLEPAETFERFRLRPISME